MMNDDAIKECGIHTAQEVVRNMGVSSGEASKAWQQANMQRGDDGLTYSAVYYACTFPDQPFVPKDLPPEVITEPGTTVTWPPPNPYPVPRPEPSTTDQELGALKHRVGLLEDGLTKHIASVEEKLGLLEDQMRELVEKFKRRGKR